MRRVLCLFACLLVAFPVQVFAAEGIVSSNDLEPHAVVFSEFMANPLDESTGEFIELYNPGDTPVDLNGWILHDLVDTKDVVKDYTGPFDVGVSGTVLAPHAYALIIDPDYAGEYNDLVEAHADLTSLLMLTVDDSSLGNGLGNASDTITLQSSDGITTLSHAWSSDAGNGISWAGYSLGSENEAWKKSAQLEGTSPGCTNNMAPSAALSKDEDGGAAPFEAAFDASESLDPENMPMNFSMDFGDGETSTQNTQVFHHAYTQTGTYIATITITDIEGAQNQAHEKITVTAKPVDIPCNLVVTEILPNPVGDDATAEFIEIHNIGTSSCNLGSYSLDDADGGSSPFALPATNLGAGLFQAFYSNVTHITLNNTSDAARILNSKMEVVSQTSYTDAKEGQAFAVQGNAFSWTTTPTPNAENVVTSSSSGDGQETTNTEPEPDDAPKLSSIKDAKKLASGEEVLVEGFVIAKAGTLGSQYMYISDGTAGLQIYSSKKLFPKTKLGQKIRVHGTLSKTANTVRVLTHDVSDIAVLASTQNIRALTRKTGKVSHSDEGTLVVVSGKITKKLGTQALMNDGSGSLIVAFREGSGLKATSVKTGDAVTIQGIVTLSGDKIEVLPRQTSDVRTTSSIQTKAYSGSLPKAGMDLPGLLLLVLFVGSVVFVAYQLLRAKISSTLSSASTKKSGKNFGATILSLSESAATSRGAILPTKRS